MNNKQKIILYLAKKGETFTFLNLSKLTNIPYASFHRTVAKMQDTTEVETKGKSKLIKIKWNKITKAYLTIAYYAMLYAKKVILLKKGYEVKTHEAAQIAPGHLLVPDELEKEDLEILNQTHKIFEDEYVTYFEDARKESSTARYQARSSYTKRRVDEII